MEEEQENLNESNGFTEVVVDKPNSWISKCSKSRHAEKWLVFFAFIEASFFPLPPSALMIAILSSEERYKRWIYYSLITTIASVLGGLFGYLIGFVFYDSIGKSIIDAYNFGKESIIVGTMFKENAFWAIFVAAFTPIPYKIFTLSAGFFKINIFTFIVASFLGRGIRFFLVGFAMKLLGQKTGEKFMKYVNVGALIVTVVIIIYFFYKVLQFFLANPFL